MVVRKDELEIQLKNEHLLINQGVLKDDSPLETSPEFRKLCDACRRGDLKDCQEAIITGVNINARDEFDYTPLILASLCGHYEVVQLLLESGALCERDTFQGERCLYNALTNRIRNLLLQYDYSKSRDPLQPLAAHITSLLTRPTPKTSDIALTAGDETFHAHEFILAARSPYFQAKLAAAPETSHWKLAHSIPSEAFQVVLRYLYLGEVPTDLGLGPNSTVSEEEVLKGIDKVSRLLGIEQLWEGILAGQDRRIARQRHQDEVTRGRDQIEAWFHNSVLKNRIVCPTEKAKDVKWVRDNSIFADVLLRADAETDQEEAALEEVPSSSKLAAASADGVDVQSLGIPVGPSSTAANPSSAKPKSKRQSVLFPCHRAMLLRSEYFMTMFSSSFLEAQDTSEYLHIVTVDCSPDVLEIVLTFLYTEKADIALDLAIDVLFAADNLFIEKLKTKAAVTISTLGNGAGGRLVDRTHGDAQKEAGGDGPHGDEVIDIYDVLRAAWMTRVQRLEEFAARYFAYRLEDYIDEGEFGEIMQESANRVKERQETDTIVLLDDIRYYLSERFRLRFEDSGLGEMMDDHGGLSAEAAQAVAIHSQLLRDEAIDVDAPPQGEAAQQADADRAKAALGHRVSGMIIRTLDGDIAGDEFASDAINYQVLLRKVDRLLERLKLEG